LYFFGYVETEQDDSNLTGFFNYEEHKPEHLEQYYKFKEWNLNQLKYVSLNKEKILENSH